MDEHLQIHHGLMQPSWWRLCEVTVDVLPWPAGLITGPNWWQRAGRMPLGWDTVSLTDGSDEWLVVRSLCHQLPFGNQRSWSFLLYVWAQIYFIDNIVGLWWFTQRYSSKVMSKQSDYFSKTSRLQLFMLVFVYVLFMTVSLIWSPMKNVMLEQTYDI